jgi:hypothetical protein
VRSGLQPRGEVEEGRAKRRRGDQLRAAWLRPRPLSCLLQDQRQHVDVIGRYWGPWSPLVRGESGPSWAGRDLVTRYQRQ